MSSKLAKLGLFDARVPRYTSYPTAHQFSTDVSSGDIRSWIQNIPPHSEISLYLHVPFCRSLCWFCACRTQGASTLTPVARYVETLQKEISLLGQFLPEGVTLNRMHWGGGTPTLLSADMIETLSNAIYEVAPLAANADFSVEIDVKEVDSARINALARTGMTRACIGVQDFDPEIQSTIGRIQGFAVTRDATQALREANVKSLNADILFGLPHQNETRMATSVQKLLTLNPDRVALYGYAHVPWMARRQCMIPSDTLPTPENRYALFETGRRLLNWDGYHQIGIDHFATPDDSLTIAVRSGSLRRGFQGYTDDPSDVLIGLGASAISRYPHGYAQNFGATSDYRKAIDAGDFAIHKGHALTSEDKLRARIIENILCDFRLNLHDITAQFPGSTGQVTQMLCDLSARFGDIVRLSEDGLQILPEAQPLARTIARHFDAYDMSGAGQTTAV